MKIQDLELSLQELSRANSVMCSGVRQRNKFDRNLQKKTDEIEGYNFDVVLEKRKFHRITITTMDKVPVVEDSVVQAALEVGQPIRLAFSDDFKARFFQIDGQWVLSAKCTSAKLVETEVTKGK